jgi:hypothetical protein
MPNKFQFKRTTVTGRTANTTNVANSAFIDKGEFAINLTDRKVFSSDAANVIFEVGSNTTNINVSNTITAYALRAGGALGTAGQVLVSNGSAMNWETIPTTNVLYVSKGGSDTNNGLINRPYLTIKAALAVATSGSTVYVLDGDYTENNPLTVPAGVSVIGNSLRTVNVIAQNATSDLFWLNNGTYVKEITIKGYTSPAAGFAFPTAGAGVVTRSPYILNCTSLTTTGTALRVDGSKATGTGAIHAGLFTIINQGGIGVDISNRGYSQLVNIYTICTAISVRTESGGFCTLNCSDTSFGNFGLVSNGTSAAINSGFSNGVNQSGNTFVISGLANTPFINSTLKFTGDAAYYTVTGVTPMVSNTSTVNINETILIPVANNTAATFYQRSQITASGHTFEYCGSGTNLANASPFAGGISNTATEVTATNGGVVNYTSTDQFGNFSIGSSLTINGPNAVINGDTFQRSLFGIMTPYILALES